MVTSEPASSDGVEDEMRAYTQTAHLKAVNFYAALLC